ncbi:MAG: hypothetical protein WCR06_03340 [bacterium]
MREENEVTDFTEPKSPRKSTFWGCLGKIVIAAFAVVALLAVAIFIACLSMR